MVQALRSDGKVECPAVSTDKTVLCRPSVRGRSAFELSVIRINNELKEGPSFTTSKPIYGAESLLVKEYSGQR